MSQASSSTFIISSSTSTVTFLKRALFGLLVAQSARVAYRHYYTPATTTSTSTTNNYNTLSNMPKAPVIVLSHGGGPLPILNDPLHKDIIGSLTKRVPKILGIGTPNEPKAIALVTAHWQTNVPSISSGKKHDLLYDYYGFPKETYDLKYDAPGSPEIAEAITSALKAEGLEAKLDPVRGWDHGVFVPMLLIHPAATIPIIQVSVLTSEDPTSHFRLGAALNTLRNQNIAILGSGFASIHNLRTMMTLIRNPGNSMSQEVFKANNEEWNAALENAVTKEKREERVAALEKWREFPYAYDMHPRGGGDHFMPLLVCAGAAGDEKAYAYKDEWAGLNIWTFFWGADPVE